MQPACQPLRITPGTTYRDTVRLMQPEYAYTPITAISEAPARITAPGHGLASDWPVWIRGVVGFSDINREPEKQPPHRATLVDAGTLTINRLSAVGLNPSGGQLVYRLPVDLTGAAVTMRLLQAGVVLLTLALGAGLSLTDPGTITRELSPEQTALLVGEGLAYEFEVTFADGSVVRYLEGPIE